MENDHGPTHRTPHDLNDVLVHFGIRGLRISIGVVYAWFGFIKFFRGLSPAEHLVTRTFQVVSLGVIQPAVSRPLVGVWEVLIGLGLLTGLCMRTTLALLALQLLGAMAPLVVLPRDTWKIPFVLTMDGQFIVKDLIVIAAGFVLASTVRRTSLERKS